MELCLAELSEPWAKQRAWRHLVRTEYETFTRRPWRGERKPEVEILPIAQIEVVAGEVGKSKSFEDFEGGESFQQVGGETHRALHFCWSSLTGGVEFLSGS